MRSLLLPRLTEIFLGSNLRDARRVSAALARRLRGGRPQVFYFHGAADPYSAPCAQILPQLMAAYDVDFRFAITAPPGADANPDAARLADYARRDAQLLARAHGLEFSASAPAPSPERVAAAECAFAASLQSGRFAEAAGPISLALWQGGALPEGVDASTVLAEGSALRQRLGHYSPATFYFEGEWYWGLDRLPYLEARLLPFRRQSSACVPRLTEPRLPPLHQPATIDFYASLRSPYTYLAMRRIRALAARHGATVQLKPVLPMVMRGLPVPASKRIYISLDAKREAERHGINFGRIADPVGKPAERGLAVLMAALKRGEGAWAFFESFMDGVWAEGIDAGSATGLGKIAARAGISETLVDQALGDESWRTAVEANRAELLSLGLWGVPSFRVHGCPGWWGQDRLWAVEEDLRMMAQKSSGA